MKEYLSKIMAGESLTREESAAAFNVIMSGEATPPQIAAFLCTLRMKGESTDEIAGAVTSMREHALKVDVGDLDVVDTCGTGGDGSGTFNISTTAAFVVAGAGIPVAKHGNKAMSSKCGSADVLSELGVNLEIGPDGMAECIKEAGIGFLFAMTLHPSMKYAGPVRRELGIRTIFNILGPLTNPAGARRQVIGVFEPSLTETMAGVLESLGSVRAMIVYGQDGLDEISTTTNSKISELKDGQINTFELDPMQYIDSYSQPRDLAGGTPAENAAITRAVLEGKTGAPRDIVVLNAAAAIFAGGKADTLSEGVTLARESIDSGKAAESLENLVKASNA
jgi:anthranilate phosphoribosyltransferase